MIEPNSPRDAPPRSSQPVWKNYKVMIPLWLLMLGLVLLGLHYGVDKRVVGGGLLLFGLLSNAFAWLIALVGVVPIVGPLIVKILAIPLLWLINGMGYVVSYVAIKRGYSKDVLTYRGLTIALIIGIIMGYILGKLI
ncbi:MAG: hypothetical protein ABIP64_18910 [Burkholderiales bacterium]